MRTTPPPTSLYWLGESVLGYTHLMSKVAGAVATATPYHNEGWRPHVETHTHTSFTTLTRERERERDRQTRETAREDRETETEIERDR